RTNGFECQPVEARSHPLWHGLTTVPHKGTAHSDAAVGAFRRYSQTFPRYVVGRWYFRTVSKSFCCSFCTSWNSFLLRISAAFFSRSFFASAVSFAGSFGCAILKYSS